MGTLAEPARGDAEVAHVLGTQRVGMMAAPKWLASVGLSFKTTLRKHPPKQHNHVCFPKVQEYKKTTSIPFSDQSRKATPAAKAFEVASGPNISPLGCLNHEFPFGLPTFGWFNTLLVETHAGQAGHGQMSSPAMSNG